VLVPYWQSLKPPEFLSWYRQYASLLFKFFAPLEIIASVSAIAAATARWLVDPEGVRLLAIAAVFAFAVVAAFPLYFQRVNASFAAGTIPDDRVPAELARWARWHQGRTVLGVAAFVVATVALLGA